MVFKKYTAAAWALLAAILFAAGIPLAKQMLHSVGPMMMAAFLYLGAGAGMLLKDAGRAALRMPRTEARLSRRELPWILLMVALDIAAPILLMTGLAQTTASNASLLGNFEIVATSLAALLVFREAIGKRQWIAIALIAASCVLLSVQETDAFSFSAGSLFVLAACVCWGFENNCTRMLSLKDPSQIVVIKGLCSGACALMIAAAAGEALPAFLPMLQIMLIGFVSYGLSIYFYVKAQREMGAAMTSACYAVSPFIGALIAIILYGESVSVLFLAAAAVMVAGVGCSVAERHAHAHTHAAMVHEHAHTHDDAHHLHPHTGAVIAPHSHQHAHETMVHAHEHRPDAHHSHGHSNETNGDA